MPTIADTFTPAFRENRCNKPETKMSAVETETSRRTGRGIYINVKTRHGGKDGKVIGCHKRKDWQLISRVDSQEGEEEFQLLPNAVSIIHDSIIHAVRSVTCGAALSKSSLFQAKRNLVSNLVKNGSLSMDDSTNTASIMAGNDFLFLSYEDGQGSADILDEGDLLEAIANAVVKKKSIDITAEVTSIINHVGALELDEKETEEVYQNQNNGSGTGAEGDDSIGGNGPEPTITITMSQLEDIFARMFQEKTARMVQEEIPGMVQEEIGHLLDDNGSELRKKMSKVASNMATTVLNESVEKGFINSMDKDIINLRQHAALIDEDLKQLQLAQGIQDHEEELKTMLDPRDDV